MRNSVLNFYFFGGKRLPKNRSPFGHFAQQQLYSKIQIHTRAIWGKVTLFGSKDLEQPVIDSTFFPFLSNKLFSRTRLLYNIHICIS